MFEFDFGAKDDDDDDDAGGGAAAVNDYDGYRFGFGYGDSYDDEKDPTSALDHVDLSEVERRLEGALAGFDIPPVGGWSPASGGGGGGRGSPAGSRARGEGRGGEIGMCSSPSLSSPATSRDRDQECERSSSVWEDGEDFWNSRKRLSTIPGSSPSDAEKARSVVQTPRMFSALNGRRTALGLRSPGLGIATPKSLYDGDGFLRT